MIRTSIITVVKDDAPGLLNTFNSIQQQNFFDWEMIIVVAQSLDETLVLAKSLSIKEPRITVIYQDGYGIYTAMNEGLAVSKGEFVWFLNAGDIFTNPYTLKHAVSQITSENAHLSLIHI